MQWLPREKRDGDTEDIQALSEAEHLFKSPQFITNSPCLLNLVQLDSFFCNKKKTLLSMTLKVCSSITFLFLNQEEKQQILQLHSSLWPYRLCVVRVSWLVEKEIVNFVCSRHTGCVGALLVNMLQGERGLKWR